MVHSKEMATLVCNYSTNNEWSAAKISKELNIALNYVYKILKENKLNRGSIVISPEIKKLICEKYTNNVHPNDIAKEFNIHYKTVYNILKKYKIPLKWQINSDEKEQVCILYTKELLKPIEIALKLNISSFSVLRILNENNIELRSKISKKIRSEVCNLFVNDKLTKKEISKQLNISNKAIISILKENKIYISDKSLSKEDEEKICYLYTNSQLTKNKISKQIGCSITHLTKILEKYNIPNRRKIISEEIEKEISEYYSNRKFKIKNILSKFNCSFQKVCNIRKKYKIENRRKILTDSFKLQVCEDYKQDSSLQRISKKHKIGINTLNKILNEYCISNKLRVNDNFFEMLDNKNSCYYAGLIASDGYVSGTTNKISLGFKKEDIEILENFKKVIGSEHKISCYDSYDQRTNKNYGHCSIQISREKLHSDLIKHGISNTKSKDMRVPTNIPITLIHYYIRGWSDGDGGWYISKKQNLVYTLVSSSYEYILDLKKIIEENCNLNTNSIVDCRPKENCFKVTYGGNLQVRKIFEYLYKDDPYPRLERKYNLLKNHFDEYDRKHPNKYQEYLKNKNVENDQNIELEKFKLQQLKELNLQYQNSNSFLELEEFEIKKEKIENMSFDEIQEIKKTITKNKSKQ